MAKIRFTLAAAMAAIAGVMVLVTPATSEAALTAYICNDNTCSGGDDFIVNDGDGDGLVVINQVNYGGFFFTANISQSAPALSQGMDLNFVATSGGGGGGTIFMYALESGFPGPASVTAALASTVDATGSILSQLCVSNSCVYSTNSGNFVANLGPLNTLNNPWVGQLGLRITLAGANQTATGDFRMNVPEPGTLALLGLGLLGFGFSQRRVKR